MELIFEDIEGEPVARLSHKADGSPRVADGVRFFNLPQAAVHFKLSDAALRDLHRTTFEDVVDLASAAASADGGEGRSPAMPPVNLTDVAKSDLLRHYLFPSLDDAEFAIYMDFCRQRGIDPWEKEVVPKVEFDADGKRDLVMITTVQYMRRIAEQSGVYAGQLGPEWCGTDGVWRDVWTPSEPPMAARIGILRRDHDGPIWGVAKFEELVQRDDRGRVDEFWSRMPSAQLAKCAEVAGHRKAFGAAAKLYIAEEVQNRPRGPRPPRPAGSAAEDVSIVSREIVATDDGDEADVPQTPRQLELALLDLGLREPSRRRDVIDGFRKEFGLRVQGPSFYAKVLAAVRANPGLYGAHSPAAA